MGCSKQASTTLFEKLQIEKMDLGEDLYLKMNDCCFDQPCVEMEIIEGTPFLYLLAFLQRSTYHC